MNTRTLSLAALVLALASSSAFADSKEKLGETVLFYATEVADMHQGTPPSADHSAEACRSLLASLAQAGVADGDRLYGPFYTNNQSEYVHVDPDKNNQHYTTLGEAKKMCDDFAGMMPAFSAVPAIFQAQTALDSKSQFSVDNVPETFGDGLIATGQACTKAVDDALAAGASPDQALVLVASTMGSDPLAVKLGDAKDKYCQPVIDWGNAWTGQLHELAAKNEAEIEAPYRAVGIKGDRLALFVGYGDPEDAGFYLPGCDRFAEDAKTMKKAKKLFIWLEDGDGPVTLRKYVFKGDKYTISERTFDFKDSAYRWCK